MGGLGALSAVVLGSVVYVFRTSSFNMEPTNVLIGAGMVLVFALWAGALVPPMVSCTRDLFSGTAVQASTRFVAVWQTPVTRHKEYYVEFEGIGELTPTKQQYQQMREWSKDRVCCVVYSPHTRTIWSVEEANIDPQRTQR